MKVDIREKIKEQMAKRELPAQHRTLFEKKTEQGTT